MRKSIVALVLCTTARIAAAQWDVEQPLTQTNADIFGEGIATSGSTVHVVYGNSDIRYRKSTDNGATWSSEKLIGAGVLHLTDPIIADGNDVWVVYLADIQTQMDWCCPRDDGNIYLLHSGDGGATWDGPQKLTTSRSAFRLSIAYAANTLHLVWMDFRTNAWDTYYLRSRDRGVTWDPEKRIAQAAGTFGAERPQIAVRGNGVHVTIWDDRGTNPSCMAGPTFTFAVCPDTFYLGSLDGGDTWGIEVPVSYSGAAISGRNDVAVAGASSVVINFNRSEENTADANPHMFTVRSADNGATWQPAIQLTNTAGSSDHGSIIGDGRAVHLAWHDSRSGSLAIYYALSTTEGQSWQLDEQVSTSSAEASTPLLAVTSGFVHALWLDKRSGSYQIYYRRRAVAAIPGGDGGTGSDGEPPPSEDGCGCRSARPSWLPLLAFALLFSRRRGR
ncbi:MAG TPA: sialidase family protein [Kofleriaceae bacterium]